MRLENWVKKRCLEFSSQKNRSVSETVENMPRSSYTAYALSIFISFDDLDWSWTTVTPLLFTICWFLRACC